MEFISLKDAANMFNKAVSTISRHVTVGNFKHIVVGKNRIYVHTESAAEYYQRKKERKEKGLVRREDYWKEYYKIRKMRILQKHKLNFNS